jgi:hypothetical protein
MAKTKCIPCLGANLKETLLSQVENPEVKRVIEEVDECEDPDGANFCRRKKKKLSTYQQFVSSCAKRKRAAGMTDSSLIMQECAAEWQREKTKVT